MSDDRSLSVDQLARQQAEEEKAKLYPKMAQAVKESAIELAALESRLANRVGLSV